MKLETIDSASFASCIQVQQNKMDAFSKQGTELNNEVNHSTLHQSKNFVNGNVDMQLRNVGEKNNHQDKINQHELVSAEPQNTEIAVDKEEEKVYKWDLVWVNIILLGFLHIAALYGYYIRVTSNCFTTAATIIYKILGILSTIGITGGAHRLWTHKSYKANNALQCILMFTATMTYQNSIYVWARDHRLHHKCSETDADPHNAKRGFFFSHVGWLLVRKHPEVIEQGKTIDMSDLKANPIVMFQHRYYYPLVLLGVVVLPYCIAFYFNFPWQEAFFTCICYKYIISVNLTWCINSLAHLYGQRPYDRSIGPTESQIMRYCAFGEGFHNYHHTFPWDYKAAEFGNDTRNITTAFIDLFAWLGWATDLRVASQDVIDKRCERTGGPGREYHMMKNNPDRTFHNIASFIVLFLYIYLI